MYFFLVDVHEYNEQQRGPNTQFDRIDSDLSIDLILILFD